MAHNKYYSTFQKIGLLTISSLLVACGGGDEGAESQPAASGGSGSDVITTAATIEGSAVKGTIENGIVSAYLINGLGQPLSSAIAPATRTDENGNYTLTIPELSGPVSLHIELTADDTTLMTCDVAAGCGADGSGMPIRFGEKFAVGSDFTLSTAISDVMPGSSVSAHMSPLSHLAFKYAASQAGGAIDSNIAEAFSTIETLFELQSGTLQLAPADLVNLSSNSFSQAQLELGVVSAAFLALVENGTWGSVSEVLEEASSSIETSGSLSATGTDNSDVSLDNLFLEAAELAVELSEQAGNETYASALTAVGSETLESYESVTDTQPEPIEVVILQQPSSFETNEGESVTFSVSAQGGELTYQWRKDGVNIAGATDSVLSISSTGLVDAGIYDVVISNSYESQVSLSANLAVNVIAEPEEPVNPPSVQVVILEQPSSLSVAEGEAVMFSVTAEGGSLSYQWRKDGVNIAGATGSAFGINGAGLNDAGSYDVVITNGADTEASLAATLAVNEVIVPVSLEIAWDIPTERADGSALELSDIEGYVIAYGTDESNLNALIEVGGASSTSATLTDIDPDIYYVTIATVDMDGTRGNFSSPVSIDLL